MTRLLWRKAGIQGGDPCIKGTGIPCSFIASRYAAGDNIAELAKDYDVSPDAIEAAIRLVVFAKGPSLRGLSAAAKVARVLPLLP